MVGFGGIEKLIINFAVIFIVATIAAGVLPGTANKLFDSVKDKLGFADPSIADFSVRVKDANYFSVGYSILGDFRKVDKVVVSRSYSEYVDNPPGSRDPIKKDVLTLDDVTAQNILIDDKGHRISDNVRIVDNIIASKAVGLHRFTIELYMTDGEVISDDELIGLYDEDYLENYKESIGGKDYDAIQCKRDLISATLLGKSPFGYAAQKFSGCEADVGYFEYNGWKYGMWHKLCEDYRRANSGCDCLESGLPGCTENQVNELNFQASRAWMWRAACRGEVNSGGASFSVPNNAPLEAYEEKYKQLSQEKLVEYMREGIHFREDDIGLHGGSHDGRRGLLVCSEEVRTALASRGFVPLTDTRESEAENNLMRILKELLGTRIKSLTADYFQGPALVDPIPGQTKPMTIFLNWGIEGFAKEDLGSLRLDYDFLSAEMGIEIDPEGFYHSNYGIYFRHTDTGWEWSPDKENWMDTSTTTVSGGDDDGDSPTTNNKKIIHFLEEYNPTTEQIDAGAVYLKGIELGKDVSSVAVTIDSEMLSRNIKLAAIVDGRYTLRKFSQKFRLVPIDNDGNENLEGAKEAVIKVFDTNYLEYYFDNYFYDSQGDKKCDDCDVQREKILVLNRGAKSVRLAAYDALLDKLGVSELPECERDGDKIKESCRPDYSDELYINYLNRMLNNNVDLLKKLDSCDPSEIITSGQKANDKVCESKTKLKEALQSDEGWIEVNTERIPPHIYNVGLDITEW